MTDLTGSAAMRNVPAHVIDAIVADFRASWDRLAPMIPAIYKTESPIEAALAAAFVYLGQNGETIVLCHDRENIPKKWDTLILPQENIGDYRVDFLVMTTRGRIIVECDGHNWHESTKEQAARDKTRDRYFASLGMLVMRFTGSEIWADALGCAKQVIEVAERMVWGQLEP